MLALVTGKRDQLKAKLLVGNNGRSRENSAGRQMRGFLQRANLSAINTIFGCSSGNTWFSTRGFSSRIDYILTSPFFVSETKNIIVDRRKGLLLQNQEITQLADHCPIIWTFSSLNLGFDSGRFTPWSKEQLQFISQNPDLVQEFYRELDEWSAKDLTLEAVERATQSGNVDLLWNLINEAVTTALEPFTSPALCTELSSRMP